MKINPIINAGIASFKAIPEKPALTIIRCLNSLRLRQVYRLKIPRTVTLFLTNRCNASCRHCFYWKEISRKKTELSFEEVVSLLKNLQGVKAINLTGGEPFLRDDLLHIGKACVAAGIKTISIPTNGILTDRITHFAKEMVQTQGLSFLKINVSLDGPEKTHDSIRNVDGCFANAKKTIENLKIVRRGAKNFQVGAATVVSADNFKIMESFIPELFNLDVPFMVSAVRGSEVHAFGMSKEFKHDLNPKESKYLTIADLESIRSMLYRNAAKYGHANWNSFQRIKLDLTIDIIKNRKKLIECLAGYFDGVIFHDGSVSLCEYTNPIGNLRDVDMDFKKIWWSEAANQQRERKKNCACIHTCNLMSNMQYNPRLLTNIIRNR